jgi:cytochrome b subunit of formate dehydrogenase
MAAVLFVAGVLLVVSGVILWSVPAGLVAAGVGSLLASVDLRRGRL